MSATSDLLGYAGKRVLVSGCYSGMGAATARLLGTLGAEVHGFDYQDASAGPFASFAHVDMRDPASIEAAAGALRQRVGGRLDALFNCAGLGPTFSQTDIMKVNFIGTRHLTEQVLSMLGEGGAIASVASTAAMGWSRRVEVHKQLLACNGYAAALAWYDAHGAAQGDAYSFSKEAVVVWTFSISEDLVSRGIRVNAVLPGLTKTPMLDDQIAVKTDPAILEEVILPAGRPGTPEEQAFVLAMLNSAPASYINGVAYNVDGGRFARLAMR